MFGIPCPALYEAAPPAVNWRTLGERVSVGHHPDAQAFGLARPLRNSAKFLVLVLFVVIQFTCLHTFFIPPLGTACFLSLAVSRRCLLFSFAFCLPHKRPQAASALPWSAPPLESQPVFVSIRNHHRYDPTPTSLPAPTLPASRPPSTDHVRPPMFGYTSTLPAAAAPAEEASCGQGAKRARRHPRLLVVSSRNRDCSIDHFKQPWSF